MSIQLFSFLKARARAAIAVAATGAMISACSLGNLSHDDCQNNAECEGAFGLGSACQSGFCTTPPRCESATDCGALFGGGACVKNVCTAQCDGKRADGIACYACPPAKPLDVLNTCTDAMCEPFDNKRVTKLNADGSLPPLPATP